MTTLTEFGDGIEQSVVAYAYEVARFSVFDDPETPDRKFTDWSWHVDREQPSQDDWDQSENTEHRLRNITPLVRGGKDADDALAYEYTYAGQNGEQRDVLDTNDPRGADALIRCTPLVPASDVDTDQ